MRKLIPFIALLLAPLAFGQSADPVHLHWSDNSDNEDGFSVERRLVLDGHEGQFEVVGKTEANVAEYVDSPPAGVYDYRVRAFNAFGYSGYTNVHRVKVEGPPNAPSGLGSGDTTTARPQQNRGNL